METLTPKAVFLSYASQDADAARRIADALRAFGVEVWFDQSELRGGDAWDQKIRRQIHECTLFLPIISATTQERVEGYFRREWHLAIDRTLDLAEGVPFIVPVVVDAVPQKSATVPEQFLRVQWTHLPHGVPSPQFVEQVKHLLAAPRKVPDTGIHDASTSHSSPIICRPAFLRPRTLVYSLVLAIMIGVVAFAVYSLRWGRQTSDSIAVMPFVNVGGDPSTEFLSDGITDSLINNLSQLSRMRVVPRSVVFRYKGKEIDPHKAGRELNVRAVLAGRVVQRNDTLSIQTELVDVSQVSQLWGEQYNRKMSDVFSVQEEIAREICEKLKLRLTREEKERITKRYTDNSQAYQLYLRGRFHWNQRTTEGLNKSVEEFRQATELDPGYALAWAGMAQSYALFSFYSILPAKDAFPRAKAAAMRALEIDDRLAEAHTALGYIKEKYEWDRAGAEQEYKRAATLNPNHPTAPHWYALLLARSKRGNEAMVEARRALDMDPLSLILNNLLGRICFFAREYDHALQYYRKTLDIDSNFRTAHREIGEVYVQKRMYEEAVASFRNALRLAKDDTHVIALLGFTYASAGKNGEAREMLDELQRLSKRQFVSPFDMAIAHVGLGEKGYALDWLERAMNDRSDWVAQLNVDPTFDLVRSDPRFQDILRRTNFSN